MATKTNNKSGSILDPNNRVKLLLVLLIVLAGAFIFLGSPLSEKVLGVRLAGLFSSASEKSRMTQMSDYYGKQVEFQGGPVADIKPVEDSSEQLCTILPCLDSNLQIKSPAVNQRLVQRRRYVIETNATDDNGPGQFLSRMQKITLHQINCSQACATPYVVTGRVFGRPYTWSISNRIPSSFLDQPVWLRVTSDNRAYNQIPITISSTQF